MDKPPVPVHPSSCWWRVGSLGPPGKCGQMAGSPILYNKSVLTFLHSFLSFPLIILLRQLWHLYNICCGSVLCPNFKEPYQKHIQAGTKCPWQDIKLWIMREPCYVNMLLPIQILVPPGLISSRATATLFLCVLPGCIKPCLITGYYVIWLLRMSAIFS